MPKPRKALISLEATAYYRYVSCCARRAFLLNRTGRAIVQGKHGSIPQNHPPILERLRLSPKHWLCMTQHFGSRFKGLFATPMPSGPLGYRRTPSLSVCTELLA